MDFSSLIQEPNLDWVDMNRFIADAFQFIASSLATIFKNETWDIVWRNVAKWFGFAMNLEDDPVGIPNLPVPTV
ncbi:MAG: hypothetical protein LBN05_04340 [Oscillospiraceae bacterium]|jgi:hypothetical protein|nr:hypothetical protein [Oscillospiraceae bacterium]